MALNRIVLGSLLDAPEVAIVQQNNCRKPSGVYLGLAKKLYETLGADPNRTPDRRPGTIVVVDIHPKRSVVCLFAQDRAGKSLTEPRLRWFEECLEQLAVTAKRRAWASVAFPDGIGCGLGGGDWSLYSRAIATWGAKHGIETVIYKTN